MTGQPFVWAARDAAVRGRVLVMVRKLCVQWVPFVHRCACATASRCPSRLEAVRLPRTVFFERVAGPRRVKGAPPPRRDGSHHDGPVADQNQMHKVLQVA